MKVLLSVVFILHNGPFISGKCFSQDILKCNPVINLSNKTQNCSVLNWSEFDQCSKVITLILRQNHITKIVNSSQTHLSHLVTLDLSSNQLQHLPSDFLSHAVLLQVLNLEHNNLQDLPPDFLKDNNNLSVLSLEGNPLPSVPPSLFQASLRRLSVDCRCNIAGSIVEITSQPCAANISSTNCTNTSFKCISSSLQWSNVKDFYDQQCTSTNLLALYICLPIVAVGIIAGIAIYCIMKRRRVRADFQSKEASSDLSPTHSQPRYMTRNVGGLSHAGPQQAQTPSKDYENIFVGPLQTEPAGQYECLDKKKEHQGPKRKQMVDEDYYMGFDTSEGDEAIYCNTQSAFYNNTKASSMEDDNVYIVPDK